MSELTDAIEDFLKQGLCTILGSRDTIAALAGIPPNTPLRDLSYPGFIKKAVCDPSSGDPSQTNLPPSSEFDEGYGWYVFASGSEFNSFTCQAGAAIPRRKVAKFSNSYTSVAATGDKERVEYPPCKYVYGKFLALTRADGTVQDGSFDGPGGVSGRLDGYEIIRYTADGYTPQSSPPPPGWNVKTGDITVGGGGGGGGITIPIAAVYAPITVNIDGTIKIPINVDVGGVKVNFNYDASRDVYYTTPSGGGKDYRPGEQPTDWEPAPGTRPPAPPAGIPAPTIGDDLADDSDPSGRRVIVAVLVTVTSIPSSVSRLYQGDNPMVGLPDLGIVQFLCRVGTKDFGWTGDIRVKNERHLIPCPIETGAIRVAGTPRTGVNWTLTPLYSRKSEPVNFDIGGGL